MSGQGSKVVAGPGQGQLDTLGSRLGPLCPARGLATTAPYATTCEEDTNIKIEENSNITPNDGAGATPSAVAEEEVTNIKIGVIFP